MKYILLTTMLLAGSAVNADIWDDIGQNPPADDKCYGWNQAEGQYDRISCGPDETEQFFKDLGKDIEKAFDW